MSLVVNEKYPGKTAGATQNYPYGEARNVSGPGNGDGTPWDAALVNDIFGLLQGLLVRANIQPNGQPDTALNSQYLQALLALFMPKQSPITAKLEENGFITIPFPVVVNGQTVEREFTIQWGVRDWNNYPGEISDSVVFPKAFKNKCFGIHATRKMLRHSEAGDAGVKPYDFSNTGFSVSLQNYGGSPGHALGYNWLAFGV